MSKTILITGSTDGIGLETAKALVALGHTVLLHGRNPTKLKNVEESLSAIPNGGQIAGYVADLSVMTNVASLAKAVAERHTQLDVLINNAGVFKISAPITNDGLDVRFVVNTLAPYLLTQHLLPLMSTSGRVVNLSSAAQSSVDVNALSGEVHISDDFTAYAQSKLALTMWSRSLGLELKDKGPMVVAVNPGSLLGTKMVKDGFGTAGNDISIGSRILTQAALSDEFLNASGSYFDNDSGRFAPPHQDALNPQKTAAVVQAIESTLAKLV